MITMRRAILRGPDSTLTVLDFGHGVKFEIVDKWGARLVQDAQRYTLVLDNIKAMTALVSGKHMKLDPFNQFISQMLLRGYRLETIPDCSTEMSNSEDGLKGAPQ